MWIGQAGKMERHRHGVTVLKDGPQSLAYLLEMRPGRAMYVDAG